MKRAWKLLVWLVGVAVYLGVPPSAAGGDLGIRFAEMPVGLQAYYQGSNSQRWVDIYLGKHNGHYVLERRKGSAYGDVQFLQYFDADGHEIRREYANGKTREFSPRHCMRVTGACRYTYHLSNGATGEGVGLLKAHGDALHYEWYTAAAPNVIRARYQLGDYGLLSYLRSNDMLLVLKEVVLP